MSKIRSLPRFCIGLSAAALLTLGLAGQAQSESRHPVFNSLSSLQATFQGLADAIREHHEEELRQEQQRRLEEQRSRREYWVGDHADDRGMNLWEFSGLQPW